MKFFHRTPFFLLLFSLAVGILIYNLTDQFYRFLLVVPALALLLALLPVFIQKSELNYHYRWIFGLAASLLLISLGYGLSYRFDKAHTFAQLNEAAVYEVELVDAPLEKTKSYLCKVKLLNRYDSLQVMEVAGNAMLYIEKDSLVEALLIGDKLLVQATFKSPDGVQNPDGFDYTTYLKRQGVGATAYLSSDYWQLSPHEAAKGLRRWADMSRRNLLNVYKTYGFKGDEYAVLAALTLGYKDELQPHIKLVYSATGAAHILAVSGLHVGVVYGSVFLLLGFLNRNRKQRIARSLTATLFIWVYAFITGLSPAVIRASLMLSFVSLAGTMERRPQIFNTILMSAFFMLLVNPNLLFNVSFQLSYAAVLSIVAFQPLVTRWWRPKNRALKWTWNLIAVSLAAQMGTAPITIYYFGQFPSYFLLTNLIAIPLSSFIIYLALLLFAISFFALLANPVAFVLSKAVALLNVSLVKIIDLPGSLLLINITGVQVVLMSLAALFLLFYFTNKMRNSLLWGLFFMLLFSVSLGLRRYQSLTQEKMLVYADSRFSAINFIDGKNNLLFSTDFENTETLVGNYWKRLLLNPVADIQTSDLHDAGFVFFKDKKVLILTEDFVKNRLTEKLVEVDYLIVGNRVKSDLEALLQVVKPRQVIIDKTISPWYVEKIKANSVAQGIEVYSVAESGSFLVEL